jgi:hypothetical protein
MVPAPKWIPIGDLTESTKAGSGRVSNMRPTAQEIVLAMPLASGCPAQTAPG